MGLGLGKMVEGSMSCRLEKVGLEFEEVVGGDDFDAVFLEQAGGDTGVVGEGAGF